MLRSSGILYVDQIAGLPSIYYPCIILKRYANSCLHLGGFLLDKCRILEEREIERANFVVFIYFFRL